MPLYKAFDIVSVPFPFTDTAHTKKRPALIVSSEPFNTAAGHSIMMMITSARHERWPMDIVIKDLEFTGLPKPSLIRMKLFTLDNRLVINILGELSEHDKASVTKALHTLLLNP